ncbi:MAG: type III pantothenate kinase [Saprospiraceae bacterium]|nr:type III pantothenate kinase [Saprospiraceae bacterium]
MSNRLCIDLGNSRCKYAIYNEEDEVLLYKNTVDLDLEVIHELMFEFEAEKIGLCTTRNIAEGDLHQIGEKWHLFIIDHQTKVPIINHYKTPATLGKDRLAAVVAATVHYASENCIVVSAGTCITYDFVDAEKNYYGGVIAPGIKMRLEAMHHFTDKLPSVEVFLNEEIIGGSTVEALQNGGVWGAILEFDSFIEKIEAKFGKCKVILSGGDAIFFAENSKFEIFAHSNLVLDGLNEIMRFNDIQ